MNFLRSRRLAVYGAHKAVKPRTIEEYQWDLHFFLEFMQARGIHSYNGVTDKDVLAYIQYVQTATTDGVQPRNGGTSSV